MAKQIIKQCGIYKVIINTPDLTNEELEAKEFEELRKLYNLFSSTNNELKQKEK